MKKNSKKALFDDPSTFPRPLYISNVAKASIVNWFQNWIFVARSAISGIPKFVEIFFWHIFKNLRYPRKGVSVHKNKILRPLNNRYFCHITNIKWSQILKSSIRKCVLLIDIQFLDPLDIKFPFTMFKTYHHRKYKGQREKKNCFGIRELQRTTWEHVEVIIWRFAL